MVCEKKVANIGKRCVACGNCVKSCPLGVISVHKGLYAVIDENRCVGCGKCSKACPAGVIEIIAREAIRHEKKMV